MPIDALPNDLDALRALVSQLTSERDVAIAESRRLTEQNDQLRHLLKQLQRAQFGQRSERLDRDQMQLALEDIETSLANRNAEEEGQQSSAADKAAGQGKKRRINRGALPAHLPRVHVTIEPESIVCPCCHGAMHVIGEESSQRLDKIPAQYQVTPARLGQDCGRRDARSGARSRPRPHQDRLLLGDSRDDRPWGGSDPPGVVYTYAPGRGGEHAIALLAGYSGIIQCDGYAVYEQLADPTRDGGAVTLAFCWSHWRREFFDIDKGGPAPIAHEALERVAVLYAIESRIRGRSAEERRAVRQAEKKPLVEKLKAWLETRLIAVSEKSTIAEAIRYGLNRWDGLVRFLDDGRIEMDTNSVERAMRPIATTDSFCTSFSTV
jgi:hypothetical protein